MEMDVISIIAMAINEYNASENMDDPILLSQK